MSDYALHCGDALTVLKTLPSGSVQCCVTSPPYYGLRSYLPDDHPDKEYELGAEETPEAYVSRMVDVFREVRRVLRDDGVLFLNIGDSYYNYRPGGVSQTKQTIAKHNGSVVQYSSKRNATFEGIKEKDLLGIPWLLAFALRADGWWLRQEIIWHKLAPMPESVTDRCTKAHEQVFLLAKSREYFFDAEAIKEKSTGHDPGTMGVHDSNKFDRSSGNTNGMGKTTLHTLATTRNKRSVWTLGPEQYSGSHYAVMPTKLVEPCVLAGTSAKGCCSACGSPYERVVEIAKEGVRHVSPKDSNPNRNDGPEVVSSGLHSQYFTKTSTTVDWQPTCTCYADIAPCTVIDPFAGSGTTLAVALKFGRRAIGIDLDERNMKLIHERVGKMQPMLFSEVTA